jgi:hypothetical protein
MEREGKRGGMFLEWVSCYWVFKLFDKFIKQKLILITIYLKVKNTGVKYILLPVRLQAHWQRYGFWSKKIVFSIVFFDYFC